MLLPFAIDDAWIAIAGAIALFVLPAGSKNWEVKRRLLHWEDARNLAWDILLMFGGGLALAGSLENAGIMEKLGSLLASYAGDNVFLLMLLIVAGSIFLSEVMSNVAFVIVLAPVIAQLSDVMGLDPLQMSIPMTLAASCSAMLPMGTPPNAIVFSSGLVPIKEMLKAGFILNLISTAIVTAFSWYVLPLVFN
jgi:sodium-dependent dicarboxylate transporter 2/3/5